MKEMEGLAKKGGASFRVIMVVLMIMGWQTCALANLIKVGGARGWNENVDYTLWSSQQHIYVGDWLYFVFDKRYYNVLEVNKTSYEHCNDRVFISNITRGGRDVFQVTEARPYYFISGGGYCFHGFRVSVNVEEAPVPTPSPATLEAPAPAETKNAASPPISKPGPTSILMIFITLSLAFILADPLHARTMIH